MQLFYKVLQILQILQTRRTTHRALQILMKSRQWSLLQMLYLSIVHESKFRLKEEEKCLGDVYQMFIQHCAR